MLITLPWTKTLIYHRNAPLRKVESEAWCAWILLQFKLIGKFMNDKTKLAII